MPFVPQDVLDRLTSLERQVRQLTGRAQMRPALNQVLNGDVQIGEGGQLIVRSPDDITSMLIGDLDTTTGGKEFGIRLRRRDGSEALSIWNGVRTDEAQAFRIKDAHGNDLLTEDVTTEGLYRPWIPYGTPIPSDYNLWPKTTSTAWEEIARIRASTQHPRLRYYLTALESSGTEGQSRITVDGTPVATSGSGDPAMQGVASIPSYEFGKEVDIRIEARRISGTGTVYVAPHALYGVGSAA
ncbi:hypothetical protein RKD32_003959 [Streptomyces sp. SAI-195]|uniref:hypothetical protein n=1 Tax=Streptomyces sp. SAI-195 TaxID=3377734 RepID=UPI003C79C3D2